MTAVLDHLGIKHNILITASPNNGEKVLFEFSLKGLDDHDKKELLIQFDSSINGSYLRTF